MRYLKALFILMVASVLFSCGTYRYGDKTYQSREKALEAQKQDLENLRAEFKPLKEPLAKKARFVIPSKDLLRERATRGGQQAGRDYVGTAIYNDMQNTGESIRTRNIFEQLDIEDSPDGDHITPKEGEVVIYFYIPDNKTGGWYYVSTVTKRTPLHFDRGNPDKVGRVKYFIDSVEALAAGEPK